MAITCLSILTISLSLNLSSLSLPFIYIYLFIYFVNQGRAPVMVGLPSATTNGSGSVAGLHANRGKGDGQRVESNTLGRASNKQRGGNQKEVRNSLGSYAHGGRKRTLSEDDKTMDKGKRMLEERATGEPLNITPLAVLPPTVRSTPKNNGGNSVPKKKFGRSG